MPAEKIYGAPIMTTSAGGGVLSIFQKADVKIIALTPKNSPGPAFLSHVNTSRPFTEDEVIDFLSEFAGKSGVRWGAADKGEVGVSLQFLFIAPEVAPKTLRSKLGKAGDPTVAAGEWEKLARDGGARREAEEVSKMIMEQRRAWVSSDRRFLATWSGNGRAIGICRLVPK